MNIINELLSSLWISSSYTSNSCKLNRWKVHVVVIFSYCFTILLTAMKMMIWNKNNLESVYAIRLYTNICTLTIMKTRLILWGKSVKKRSIIQEREYLKFASPITKLRQGRESLSNETEWRKRSEPYFLKKTPEIVLQSSGFDSLCRFVCSFIWIFTREIFRTWGNIK